MEADPRLGRCRVCWSNEKSRAPPQGEPRRSRPCNLQLLTLLDPTDQECPPLEPLGPRPSTARVEDSLLARGTGWKRAKKHNGATAKLVSCLGGWTSKAGIRELENLAASADAWDEVRREIDLQGRPTPPRKSRCRSCFESALAAHSRRGIARREGGTS